MFTDPIKNLNALGLREDDIVADLGAGTGYYSLFAGALVAKGKVYAVELDKNYLETIKHKVKESHIKNVEIIWGNIEKIGGTKLADGIADAVIVSNVLFSIEDKQAFMEEIKRILKPGGKVLLVDWREDSVMGSRITIPKAKSLGIFEKAGFALARDIDAGNHHYGMILNKKQNKE